jgi:predicted alpha/beta-hydrolase family hydrolase
MQKSERSLSNPDEWTVEFETGAVTALAYERQGPPAGASLILAHGAGAGQRSTFMIEFASALAADGLDIITFNFPYTEQHRKLPDRAPVLEACYRAVIAAVHRRQSGTRTRLFIGGKSMGGRIATQVAATDPALPVTGLVLLGYPLHPPGRPEQRRDAHLPRVQRPTLIVQGRRDTFGTPEEFDPVLAAMTPRPALHVVEGGDHSFKVSRAKNQTQADVHRTIQQTILDWIATVD